MRTSCQRLLHSQFSILNSQLSHRLAHADSAPSHSSFRAEPLFTFKLLQQFSHANPAPRVVPLSILNFQFSTVAPPCTCGFRAKPLFTSRRATLHFQVIATIFACELRAKGRSTFNFQFSILNCRTALCMRTPRQAALHFAQNHSSLSHYRNDFLMRTARQRPSTLNFQLSHRLAHADSTPSRSSLRVEPLFTFKLLQLFSHANRAPKAVHSQFSILNSQFSRGWRKTPRLSACTFDYAAAGDRGAGAEENTGEGPPR
jgi:hypothetical protein